nr:retrovirus-related Pol polyprotein from transposon TNT 1-94 [Tanacetum cinerariifolium]
NDHVAAILGFGDLQWGNILIARVYFVEGLGYNLFSVGQFCDSDLEVAFRRNACFVRNLEGVDLLKRDRSTNLYTINLHEMSSASPICLMAHASSTKSWLWHQRLSHLNFDTINDLARNDLVSGLSKFKYHKEHLCPSLDNTKTKRPQPRSNTKNDRVPSASKSSRSMNKDVKVEEHHRNLLLSKKNKHMSRHVIALRLILRMLYLKKPKANVSENETQQKNQPEIKKSKNVGRHKSLATPKTRLLLRWLPTGRLFDQDGKLVAPNNSESQVDCSNGDNACTSNAMEPKIKWFPNSTSLLDRLSRFVYGASTQVVPST